jgi:hypothetical protein
MNDVRRQQWLWLVVASSLFLVSACGEDKKPTAPTPPHFSRNSAVQFAVRSGTTINPAGSPGLFDTGTDEAFIEVAIDFAQSSPVVINFRVYDFSVGTTDPATTDFKVAIYDANGSAEATDYGRGVLQQSLSVPKDAPLQSYTVDVTAIVAALQAAGGTHVGLRFYGTTHDQLSVLSDATLEAGP